METIEINPRNDNQKSSNEIYSKSKKLSKIFQILQEDNLDNDEYDKINQNLNNYKKEQMNKIKNLELELKKLNEKNESYSKIEQGIDNNTIILKDDLKKILKEEIIKEIKTKILKECKEREENFFNQQKENFQNKNNINKQEIEKKLYDLKHNDLIPKITKLENKLNKLLNGNKEKNRGEQNIGDSDPKIFKDLIVKRKKGVSQHFNLRSSKSNNFDDDENNNSMIAYQKNKNNNNIQDEESIENEYDNNNIIINQINNHMNNKNKGGIGFDAKNNKYKNPVKLIDNNLLENQKKYQKKYSNEDLFTTFNNIFFQNKEQTLINAKKIDENRLEFLSNKFFKYKTLGKENELTFYFDNFIRSNILKIFSRRNESSYNKDIIKENIEAILECFKLNKYTYAKYYYPEEKNTEIRDRKKSTEAAIKFRRVFNISKSIIKDEELIKKLDENDNDIYKVLQIMYG